MSLLPAPGEWSPLEEQFHTWDIIIINPPAYTGEAQSKVLSLWAQITITETHEGIRTQVEVNAEEPCIPFIRELVTDFMFLRDGELLYRLRVVDSEDVLTRDAATVRFDCVSYDKLLERRILHEDWLLDDGDINAAWRLIDYTQRRQSFGITRGTTSPGIRRQRALDAGDDILTAINDFAQADTGFDWWIDANLRFWAVKPRRGKRHNIQWQLGGEVGEMTRLNPIEDYSSLIMATGANSEVRIPRADGNEDVYPPPDPQIVQLASKPLGLWEMTTSDTDVITTASLMEKALWHLADKGTVRPTYKIALEPGVWTPVVAIGDIVNLRINTVRANVKVPIRIEELSINCSSDGAEVISMSVRAEEPETPISVTGGPSPLPMLLAGGAPDPNGRTVARHRLSEADDLGALLRSLRKRLDRAERSRGIGGGSGSSILDGEGPPTCLIGSPGDYYVDRLDWRLYGPKYDGGSMLQPPVSWNFREMVSTPNDRVLNKEVGFVGYVFEDVDIVGFKFDGLTCGITDTFDRANGPLGDDWASCPAIPAWNTANHDLAIIDVSASGGYADKGAAATVADTTAPVSIGNTMRWAHAQPTTETQSIEVFLELKQTGNAGGGYVYLFTNAQASGPGCVLVEITHANWDMPTQPQDPLVRFTAFEADGTAHSEEESIPFYYGSSRIRIRLESDPDGEHRLYYDPTQYTTGGEIVLLKTWQSPIPVSGPYVGMGTSYGAANGFTVSPRFNAVTVGCPGAGVIGAPDVPPTPVGGTLTVSIWDWDRRQLLYRTTAPAAGTDGWVDTPPIRFSVNSTVAEAATGASSRWCVSIGGAEVPVRTPGNQFIYDDWPPLVGSYGPYMGPVGQSPETSQGYFGVFPLLYVAFQSQKCLAATPEDVDTLSEGARAVEPNTSVSGQVGKIVSVGNAGWLHGWRYKRRATDTHPVTFSVWDWVYRYYDPQYANVKAFPEALVAEITVDHEGEGEFEVRLPTPVFMDPFGVDGPDTVMISVGGAAIGIDTTTTGIESGQLSAAGWYAYHFGHSYLNPVIGGFPNSTMGSSPNYHVWPMYPIMQRGDVPMWPTTDLKRSGGTGDPEGERAELHHNFNYSTSGNDYNGLRFYSGGPSHDATSWGKDADFWFSSSLLYDGYSGVAIYTDDWYDEEYGVVYPEPNRYTNKYAYYQWYYDYGFFEIDADLDPGNLYFPNSYFMYYEDFGAWDDDSYWAVSTYGPRHGAGITGEDSGTTDGGAGFHCEVSSIGPLTKGNSVANVTTALAQMHAIADDGIHGTQLTCTTKVIQACFPPEGVYNTWWYGDGSAHQALTPKGCVSPLITAAAATATAADEPWQKQYFRQMGTNTVSFTAGLGTVGVPTAMALPAVVNAQIDGVTVGGPRIAQAQRTGDYVITLALDTAYTGNLSVNWNVEHAALTFGTPPPSIDIIRNPGSFYSYGPYVEYDAGGGAWPFELNSAGRTLQDGCILKDFSGATVGGPFTGSSAPVVDPGASYQYVLWSAQRNWYLPGQQGQFRMTNPDGQVSAWFVINWYEEDVFRSIEGDSAFRTVVGRSPEGRSVEGRIAEEPPEGIPAPPARYANNPRLHNEPIDEGAPGVELLGGDRPATRGPDSPRERRPRTGKGARDQRGGKERQQGRVARQRQERAEKAGRPPEEPPGQTTPE